MAVSNPRKAEINKDDSISTLPDSLLCHILSFLPTATSVATSILSRSWRHLWKDLQSFDFSFISKGHQRREDEHARFVALANAVLVQRNALHIRKLSLVYRPCLGMNMDTVTGWVRAAVGPHLEELRLNLWNAERGWRFVVPPSVFTCAALVDLNLSGVIVELTQASSSSSVHLPSLKTLRLLLNSPDNIDKVLSGCPVLETMHLILQRYCVCPPEISAPKIRVPSLKHLMFVDGGDSGIVQLELDTPSLEYLGIDLGYPYYQVSFIDIRNVVEAHVGYTADEDLGLVPKLLQSLCKTRSLVLKSSTVTCLLCVPILDLPEFRNLRNLELHFRDFNFDTSFLLSMLHRCDILQVLTIHKKGATLCAAASPSWTEPVNVPNCLVLHLSIVKFSRYGGSRYDQELLAYILQNGLVLTSVTIETVLNANSEKRRGISQQFCQIPKGSKSCQLNVN